MKRLLILFLTLTQFTLFASAQSLQQADSLHQRGRELLGEGKITEGRECTRQAMEIRKALLGEVSEEYITSLNNYAISFSMEEDYKQAILLQKQVMQLCGKLKQPHKNLGTYIMNMGRYYFLTDDYAHAADYFDQAIPLVEKHSEIYEKILEWLGFCYTEMGDTKRLEHIMALMDEHNRNELKKPCNEPKCMLERAQYYASTGETALAREHFLNLLAMPMDAGTKAKMFEEYARFLGNTGDYAQGGEYYLSAASLRNASGKENEVSANLRFKAGQYFFVGKRYAQSVEAYLLVVDYYRQIDTPAARKSVAQCMKGLGNAYLGLHDYEKARESYLQLANYYEQYDPDNEEYPRAILKVAKEEKYLKEFESSIEHHKQAMAMFESRNMTSDYSDAAASLQSCYAQAGVNETVDRKTDESRAARIAKIDGLIEQELTNLDMVRTYLGKLQYARSLATLGGCYEMKEDWDNSVRYYHLYMETVREAIRDEFRLQGEAERMVVWEDEKKDVAQLLQLLVEIPEENAVLQQEMAGIAFDAELLAKGVLLNSSIEFGKVLSDGGDDQLKEAFEQTKANETELQRLRLSAASDEDLSRILTLTQENQVLQLALYRGCAEFADFTNYISYTWQSVRDALGENDVAIEFAIVGSQYFSADQHLMALIISKEMDAPRAIRICDANTLKSLEASEDLYQSPLAGNTIWGTIRPYLSGKNRIFFSADGSLHRMGIEYLLINEKPMSEMYEVYRLSSTKELCYSRGRIKPSQAVLFGDINYNEDATESAAMQSLTGQKRGSSGFHNLDNTLREVNGIQSVLKAQGVDHVIALRDTEASRVAFVSLSDSQVNLIHIATHGLFRDEKASDAESMKNSVLAFAGANVDDEALVSAADIAGMNLRQCDLAVLSACETGLGKLGDDGVFGLQRGFKNAGVHTLLMSLKEVHDQSTADLMIRFYLHLMDGSTKREALVKAQQEIRQMGYTDPEYWATFILLDGVD
jgi:tetratricopeptide (TPR) repeat protein